MQAILRLLRRIGQVVIGVIVGLLVAEGLFWVRDRGAFPHVNFYKPDAKLGVRLIPRTTMRLGSAGVPVTTIHINSAGYRAPEFPDARTDEILAVGDSQTFGLGVEDEETYSAELSRITGRQVINGGIPTYGVPEYLAVADELTQKRHPSIVIMAINFSKDQTVTNRNKDVHKVLDGWAVRASQYPARQGKFPGRGFLFRHSHAIFALRKFLYARSPHPVREDLEEGGFRFGRGKPWTVFGTDISAPLGPALGLSEALREKAADIHYCDEQEECAGPIDRRADEIAQAANDLRKLELALDDVKSTRIRRADSVFDRPLTQFANLAKTRGFAPVILMIPLDTQVSNIEWRKYNVEHPVDMSKTLVLLSDLARHARSKGIAVIDATVALKAAEPGAFLPADLHMSAKGHAAVAQLVALELKRQKIRP